MLASSAIDGFNYASNVKIGTDIDDEELQKAANYREEYIEPYLPLDDNSSELRIDHQTDSWLKNNILGSGYERNPNLPGPIMTLFLIIFCIVIAFLDLGSKWYEIILKIIAFIFALSFGGIIYSLITNFVIRSDFYFKRLIHFILYLIFPLIIYLCIKVYFL